MHTHTFTSKFAVGDKITNGDETITILSVGKDIDGYVIYGVSDPGDNWITTEQSLANYYLAPKYPTGSRVWIIGNNEIREALVTNKINNVYVLEGGNYTRLENQIFPTSEDARNSLKVIPLP